MIVKERTGLVMLLLAAAVAALLTYLFREDVVGTRQRVPWDHPQVERDLEAIAADTLRILVLRDPLTWEQRPNAVTGLEYELLERFAKQEGLLLKAIPVDDPDSMLLALQTGRGDIIAAQFTPRREQRRWVDRSRPYHVVRPMVARSREDHVRGGSVLHAPDHPVTISRWSPFIDAYDTVDGKEGSPPVTVGPGTPEDQLMAVLIGTLSATVVLDAIAAHESQRFPNLEFTPFEGPERPLCFAVRTNAPDLLKRLDAWLADPDQQRFQRILIDSYLGRLPKPGALRKRTMPAHRDSISPYDADFRAYGGGFGWKWQLLAAMAWKESRFDSSAVSTKGAHGIMQFMPRTAAHYGLDTSVAVGDHINAAKRYITRLDTIWMRAVPDRDQRLRFVLASYNAGLGHIIDAQRLADRLGLDPTRWEHNVERAVLLLAKPRYYMRPEMKNGYCKGSQVFHYVRDIVALYQQLTGLPERVVPARNDTAAQE